MRCKHESCNGVIVNLGDYYGCLSCSRPLKMKVRQIKENDKLIEITETGERIEHHGILHLTPLTFRFQNQDYEKIIEPENTNAEFNL